MIQADNGQRSPLVDIVCERLIVQSIRTGEPLPAHMPPVDRRTLQRAITTARTGAALDAITARLSVQRAGGDTPGDYAIERVQAI